MKFSIAIVNITFSLCIAQNSIGDWDALTSPLKVNDLTYINGKIYAATGGGLFRINENNKYTTLTTINGLIGIDLSEEMVKKAEKKNIYDRLYVDDIIGRLEILKTQFNLFISFDVFAYIGDLIPIFSSIKRHSIRNSLLVFSTEHTNEGDFILQNTARYAHSKDYILSIAKQQGFRLECFTTCNLRYERDGWIIGGLFVLKVT